MTYSRVDIDPRVWTEERFARQLMFIAQDGGAGANFLQYMFGKHQGFYQQYDRHIPANNEYISSMPLHDAEHDMQEITFDYVEKRMTGPDARERITEVCLDVLNDDPGSKFNQWDRICAQTHCPNYHLQHLLHPEQQLLSIVPRANEDHAFYRTLDVIKQWYHPFVTAKEATFPLRDLDMETPENMAKVEEAFDAGKLKTLGDMWQLFDIYDSIEEYTHKEFMDSSNSMHLYIDTPVCDAYSIYYDDFFISRTKPAYLELCDWMRIHPMTAIYVDMVTDYYDANHYLVEQNKDVYTWFLKRMQTVRPPFQSYHTELRASEARVQHAIDNKYTAYRNTK